MLVGISAFVRNYQNCNHTNFVARIWELTCVDFNICDGVTVFFFFFLCKDNFPMYSDAKKKSSIGISVLHDYTEKT